MRTMSTNRVEQFFGRVRRGVTLAALVCAAAGASAQVSPDRMYYGVDQPVPVSIESAAGGALVLYDARDGSEVARAAVDGASADLAALFPTLWQARANRVYRLQFEAGGKGVGAPLILQPMVSPDTAFMVDPTTGQPTANPRNAQVFFESDRYEQAAQRGGAASAERPFTYSGLRVYTERYARVVTDKGELLIRMRADAAPNTVVNFMHLVEGGFYTQIPVHRIVQNVRGNRFVVQFGDPTGTGAGGPGYLIDLEKTPLQHDYGVLSMARSGDPDSGGSQVFICLSREGTGFLDGRYTAFAEIVEGVETIEAMAAVEVGAQDRPVDLPYILSAELVDAPPVDQTPERVQDPTLDAASAPAAAPDR